MKMSMAVVLLLALNIVAAAEGARKKVEVCLLPMQSGRCFGYVPSYAYDPFTRKCEEFIYGGCGGNENRFLTKSDCERMCRDV